jgi:hypothetical protein
MAKVKEVSKKPASQEVAVKPQYAVANAEDIRAMLIADAGKGVSTSPDDNLLPWIYLLQVGSPQVLRQKAEYIKGAVAGNIWPRGTQTLIDGEEGISVIPAGRLKFWVEWKPDRAGLVGRHKYWDDRPDKGRPVDAQQVQDPKSGNRIWVRDSGNHLVETDELAVLTLIGGQWNPGVLAMSSTNLTCSKAWNGEQLRQRIPELGDDFVPPSFAFIYHLKTVATSNEKGSWHKWAFEHGMGDGEVTQTLAVGGMALYKKARSLYDAYMAGEKKTDENAQGATASTAAIEDTF